MAYIYIAICIPVDSIDLRCESLVYIYHYNDIASISIAGVYCMLAIIIHKIIKSS